MVQNLLDSSNPSEKQFFAENNPELSQQNKVSGLYRQYFKMNIGGL